MSEARAILMEQRGEGSTVLVGRWPDKALIDADLLPEFSPDARLHSLKLGDDFQINLANASAVYRYVEQGEHGVLICIKLKSMRAVPAIWPR